MGHRVGVESDGAAQKRAQMQFRTHAEEVASAWATADDVIVEFENEATTPRTANRKRRLLEPMASRSPGGRLPPGRLGS